MNDEVEGAYGAGMEVVVYSGGLFEEVEQQNR